MIMIMYVCVPKSPTWCNKCGTAVWVAFTRNRLSAAFACFLSRLGNVCLAYPKESNCKSTHSHFSNCRLYSGKTLWKELFTAVPVEDGITLKLGCIIVSAEDVSMVGLNVILRVNVVTILIYIEPFWALTLRVGHEGVFSWFLVRKVSNPLGVHQEDYGRLDGSFVEIMSYSEPFQNDSENIADCGHIL